MSGPSRRSRVRRRRTTAAVALAAAASVLVLGVIVAVDDFPRGLMLLFCAALVAAGAWEGVLRRGWDRVVALAVGGVALAGGVLVLGDEG
jgi:peptidoglycan/LPS O-acetylase OafA/YrhL